MRKFLPVILILSFFLTVSCACESLATPTEVNSIQEVNSDLSSIDIVQESNALNRVKIPNRPVVMYIKRGNHSRFEIFFVDLKYEYDLVDFEFYKAWCLDKGKKIKRNSLHYVRLYNCYDPDIPSELRNVKWNQIHYILNHKNAPQSVIQEAIWYLCNSKNSLSTEAQSLISEAEEKGSNYTPGEGEVIGIICYPEKQQPVLLEYVIPPKVAAFDIAPAFFEPPLTPPVPAFTPPVVPPIIPPIIPPGPEHNDPIPDKPKPVSEPGVFLLLSGGMAVFLTMRRINRD